MKNESILGRLHSVQSLGTLDGPGIRFVAFLQGCPLRCGCCHNPDTWEMDGGEKFSAEELFFKAARFQEYFGNDGGVTLSGGEPLLQPQFSTEFFARCKASGISTCLDTSGCLWNEEIQALLNQTDLVLLDIKYTKEQDYRDYVGCEQAAPLRFLKKLNEAQIPTILRQVIIPTLNDNPENINTLNHLKESHSCVQKVELLPFRTICQTKYDSLGIPFRFADYKTPSKEEMRHLESLLK